VYYEVDRGRLYIDSADTDDSVNTIVADTNLRFLYKTVYFKKSDLFPVGSPVNWEAHVSASKRIDFEREGMPGPTAEWVTARSIDLEVVYLGGEQVALHSVAIRDSVSEMMMGTDTEHTAFQNAYLQHIDSLTRATGETYPKTVDTALHNLYLTDEPPRLQCLPFRAAKELIERSYVFPNDDTLTSNNGAALPQAQWIGHADWATNANYLVRSGISLGSRFGFYRKVGSDSVCRFR
jgi:hypothetical protein